MAALIPMAEVKNVPRSLYGFFRKSNGDILHIKAAEKTLANLNLEFCNTALDNEKIARLENCFYFHIISDMYIEDRYLLRTKRDVYYKNFLEHPGAYFSYGTKKYEFFVFILSFCLLIELPSRPETDPRSLDIWDDFHFTDAFLQGLNKGIEVLEDNKKSVLNLLDDIRVCVEKYHLHFFSFNKQAEKLTKKLSLKDQTSEEKISSCLFLLLYGHLIEKPCLPFIEKFLFDLGVDKQQLALRNITRELARSWMSTGKPYSGLAYFKAQGLDDPFDSLLETLPELLVEDQKELLSRIRKDEKFKNFIFALSCGIELRDTYPIDVSQLIEKSLLSFEVFQGKYKSRRYSMQDRNYLLYSIENYLNEKSLVIYDEYIEKIKAIDGRIHIDFMTKLLEKQKHNSRRLLKNSVVFPFLIESCQSFYETNIKEIDTLKGSHGDSLEYFNELFVFDLELPEFEFNRPEYSESDTVLHDDLHLLFDMSTTDIEKIKTRVSERLNYTQDTFVDDLIDYVCISIQKYILKTFRKKQEVSFNLKDLNFFETRGLEHAEMVQCP